MEYHNYNYPLDRIDENLVRKLLSEDFDELSVANKPKHIENRRGIEGCRQKANCKNPEFDKHPDKESISCRSDDRRDTRRTCNHKRHDCNVHCEPNKASACRREDCTDKCISANYCGGSNSVCGCGECNGFTSPELLGVPLAMVYSPHQVFDNVYGEDEGFERGTIFKCLDLPFYPTPCNNNSFSCECRDSSCRKR